MTQYFDGLFADKTQTLMNLEDLFFKALQSCQSKGFIGQPVKIEILSEMTTLSSVARCL